MNCQDISRIADSGCFDELSEAQRREAEAHTRTCRHCAPVWATHARLAELRIPPMPAELMAQVRTLAALPAQSRGGPTLRRLTLIGAVVALAAAAAWFAVHQADTAAPESKSTVVSAVPEVVPTPAPVTPKAELPVPGKVAPAPASTEVVKVKPKNALPLLLPPDNSAPERAINLAIQKTADVHPELVAGPETDGFFSGTILIRANGTLVSSNVHLIGTTPSPDDVDTRRPMYRSPIEEPPLPQESSSTQVYREKHTVLPDGRKLRADLRVQFGVIADSYDMMRSSNRVLEIVRKQHADLLLPVNGEERNRLTLFLAEDGSIQREEVEHVNRRTPLLSPPPFPIKENDPGLPARIAQYMAEDIARRLALDINQIGLTGFANLEDGKAFVVADGTGNLRSEDNRRILMVAYAWPRLAGESAPFLGFGAEDGPKTLQSGFDEAAAVAILKHEIPDAFTNKDPAAGLPGMFFTYKGELIRAGRLHAPDGGMPDKFVLVRQLAPNVQMGPGLGRDIKDETGASVNVVFAWEKAPAAPATK